MRVKSDMIENNAFSNETLIRKENLAKDEIRKSVFWPRNTFQSNT